MTEHDKSEAGQSATESATDTSENFEIPDFPDFPDESQLTEETNALSGLILPDYSEDFRAGFVAIVGRPNVGKSTLTNALVGTKVAITSRRPETTRRVIRGVVHREDYQLVLVDTPGIHRPRTLLGQRLNDMVDEAILAVDVIVFCLPADQEIGPGDRRIASNLKKGKVPVIVAVTKSDLANHNTMAPKIAEINELGEWAEIIPVSALKDRQIAELSQTLAGYMPPSAPLYPAGELTDEPENVLIAEFIREAALEGVREELPHSLAVVVEETIERPGKGGKPGVLAVHVNVYVERESQKAIIIGRGGARLRSVGTRSRKQIEALLGRHIYLDLHVKVAKNWQSDPKMLPKLGF